MLDYKHHYIANGLLTTLLLSVIHIDATSTVVSLLQPSLLSLDFLTIEPATSNLQFLINQAHMNQLMVQQQSTTFSMNDAKKLRCCFLYRLSYCHSLSKAIHCSSVDLICKRFQTGNNFFFSLFVLW